MLALLALIFYLGWWGFFIAMPICIWLDRRFREDLKDWEESEARREERLEREEEARQKKEDERDDEVAEIKDNLQKLIVRNEEEDSQWGDRLEKALSGKTDDED